MKISVNDSLSKCEQIRICLWISSHLRKLSWTINFIFCALFWKDVSHPHLYKFLRKVTIHFWIACILSNSVRQDGEFQSDVKSVIIIFVSRCSKAAAFMSAPGIILASIYLFKVNSRNSKICSKVTIKTLERRHWRRCVYCWIICRLK